VVAPSAHEYPTRAQQPPLIAFATHSTSGSRSKCSHAFATSIDQAVGV
jgi:hypothetical protein